MVDELLHHTLQIYGKRTRKNINSGDKNMSLGQEFRTRVRRTGTFFSFLFSFLFLGGVFNKTVIPLALVR